ncbi:hypothetical protein niasHT_030317 [Heterodera trifolii]|uniref:Uncharacterized protein n=1 Tax=Heterodera trifolii TaxID=157864 RepID=A0ABD2KR85_9BILA
MLLLRSVPLLSACLCFFGFLLPLPIVGLQCKQYPELEPGTKFSTAPKEVDCEGKNDICTVTNCKDESNVAIPWYTHGDCDVESRFSCEKLGEQCTAKGGTFCCHTCKKDLCNKEDLCPNTAAMRAGQQVIALVVPLLVAVFAIRAAKSLITLFCTK